MCSIFNRRRASANGGSASRDKETLARIASRLDRLAYGHAGDAKPVGHGVSELRIDHGPGYRIYYQRRGDILVVLLCRGSKKTQAKDIETAHRLAKEQDARNA